MCLRANAPRIPAAVVTSSSRVRILRDHPLRDVDLLELNASEPGILDVAGQVHRPELRAEHSRLEAREVGHAPGLLRQVVGVDIPRRLSVLADGPRQIVVAVDQRRGGKHAAGLGPVGRGRRSPLRGLSECEGRQYGRRPSERFATMARTKSRNLRFSRQSRSAAPHGQDVVGARHDAFPGRTASATLTSADDAAARRRCRRERGFPRDGTRAAARSRCNSPHRASRRPPYRRRPKSRASDRRIGSTRTTIVARARSRRVDRHAHASRLADPKRLGRRQRL